jgi:hypothetical protein
MNIRSTLARGKEKVAREDSSIAIIHDDLKAR